MANIPLTGPQVGPGLGVSPLPENRVGGAGGRTLDRIGAQAEDFLTRLAEQDAAIEGAGLLSKFRVDAETAREKLQATVTTPDNFTDLALKQFDDMSKDFLSNVPNKRAANFVEGRLADTRAQYALNSLQWETTTRNQRRALMVEDTLNSMGARVLKNPGEYDTALREWDDAVTASGVPIDVADKMRRTGKDQMAVSLAQGMIRRDPFGALKALQTDNRFTTLDPDKLESLIRSSESSIQHKAAMADHAANISERNRRLMGDQVAKDGFDLVAKGQMTDAWMEANKRTLDTADYRMLLQAMQEGGGVGSREAYASILPKVYAEGADVSGEVFSAMSRGDISVSAARSLLEENKSNAPAKRAKQFITQYLKPSEINPSIAQSQQYAEAVAEFDARFAQDPKQDPMELARTVVQRNALVNFNQMTLVMPLPFNAVGGRSNFDVRATQVETVKAFMKKHNNDRAAVLADPEYKAEVRKIAQWATAMQKAHAAESATTGATKVKVK